MCTGAIFITKWWLVSVSYDSIVISTLHCGCKNPGSNPGHSSFCCPCLLAVTYIVNHCNLATLEQRNAIITDCSYFMIDFEYRGYF